MCAHHVTPRNHDVHDDGSEFIDKENFFSQTCIIHSFSEEYFSPLPPGSKGRAPIWSCCSWQIMLMEKRALQAVTLLLKEKQMEHTVSGESLRWCQGWSLSDKKVGPPSQMEANSVEAVVPVSRSLFRCLSFLPYQPDSSLLLLFCCGVWNEF